MTTETTIYNQNATSLAAILEYIQLPNHPLHGQAVAMANEFVEANRKARIVAGQKRMQEQRENMTDAEWSSIVD
jgi:hypothetical protein